MHTTHSNTQYKHESSTVKWAQWDKTQSRELLVCSYVCASHCAQIVAHNIAQNRPDSFPPYPPDNHHISDDVYLREGGKWPNQQCQSTEGTPGSSGPKDMLQSHQVHLTVLQTYACKQHTVIHNTKMNLSTVKWAHWERTQSRELSVCSNVCASHCAQLLHTILHRTDLIVFPLTLQTITTAPMMSIWGKGGYYSAYLH